MSISFILAQTGTLLEMFPETMTVEGLTSAFRFLTLQPTLRPDKNSIDVGLLTCAMQSLKLTPALPTTSSINMAALTCAMSQLNLQPTLHANVESTTAMIVDTTTLKRKRAEEMESTGDPIPPPSKRRKMDHTTTAAPKGENPDSKLSIQLLTPPPSPPAVGSRPASPLQHQTIPDLILSASKKQETKLPIIPLTPLNSSTPNIRSHPPSPLRYQLTEKRAADPTPIIPLTPLKSSTPIIRSHPPSPLRYQLTEKYAADRTPIIRPITPTIHKYRYTVSRPLIKEVLVPSIQPLQPFKYSEKDIEIVSIIASGAQSMIYRISVNNTFFAMKVHRYEHNSHDSTTTSYPHPNPFLISETAAYAHIGAYAKYVRAFTPKCHGAITPKCHGYINLTTFPIVPEDTSHSRDAYTSIGDLAPLYHDFITQPLTPQPSSDSSSWLSYFRSAPPNSIILRGLIFTDAPILRVSKPMAFSRNIQISTVAQVTTKLKALHACGVLHGNIADQASVSLWKKKDGTDTLEVMGASRVMFIGFEHAKTKSQLGRQMFRTMAKKEVAGCEQKFSCMRKSEEEKRKVYRKIRSDREKCAKRANVKAMEWRFKGR